jgi:alpha-L-fucosidase
MESTEMPITRRKFLKTGVAAGLTAPLWLSQSAPAAPDGGPFAPSWESLAQYQCPAWFRDAKFGIWAHWTAQCVPEQGDWYARQMYQEGSHDYEYQCAHYGHPSKVGFKDIDHLWHAEHWDPERLLDLYKAAGAKYFVALAQHHDNFDCFDSKHQPWNSVAIGPKRDIVGTWAKAARKAGLRFGVTSHGSHAWSWYEVSQGSDRKGPLVGVPYDGHLTKADGKGMWWEGLDPQDLYAQNHAPGPGGLQWTWDVAKGSSIPDKAYCDKFYNRTIDLLDKYKPDLLYFDDVILPLYQVDPSIGLRIAAHHYNARRGRGRATDAVLNGKILSPAQAKCMVHDFERGRSDKIVPDPWQTDTCIGEWHYKRSLYENHQYKTANQVVRMLVDIVAKNGNLLLNIPLRGDGTIDPDEEKFLHEMAVWMSVNGESIFGTRPWSISGEGPARIRGGMFSEGGEDQLSAEDFRFTTKGRTLYATAMGWPSTGTLTVRTLAANASGLVGDVKRVQLLGAPGDLPFRRTTEGLVVTLPAQKTGDYAYVLKISGLDVAASKPSPPVPPAVQPDAAGVLMLKPNDAQFNGTLHTQSTDMAGGSPPVENIGYWDAPTDTASWRVNFAAAGSYTVSVSAATAQGPTTLMLDAGPGATVTLPMPLTGGWDKFQTITGGPLVIDTPGDRTVTARPADPATWRAMNLAFVTLTKTP